MRSGRRLAETEAEWRPAGLLGDLLPGELNDACCWACSGGGDVVCCDGCRAVYHLACINMESLPDEDFFCPLCSCKECNGPCRDRHPAVSIQTEMVPVHTRPLKPRQSPSSKLPDGPGYVCPQQLRLWLQLQPTAHLENSSDNNHQQQQQQEPEAVGKPSADEADGKQAAEPRPKRQKRDSAGTNSTPAAAAPVEADSTISGDTYIRCCCCQRGCHVKCLPEEQQQQLAAWASTPQDSADRDQNKSARGGKRMRSPKGKKQASKQDQEQQERQDQERLSRPVPPYFCSPGCRHTATELAKRCTVGVTQLDALPDGTPVCWQLIQPAAVAAALAAALASTATAAEGTVAGETAAAAGSEAPATDAAGDSSAAAVEARSALANAFAGADAPPAPVPTSALLGAGVAPAYTQQQAHVLSQVMKDTQQLLAVQLGPVWEVRTFQHCLPWLLSGLRQSTPGGLLDLSNMHVAVLWVGCTLAAAALVRVHGGEGGGVLEVTLAATTPQLQHRRLGRMLVGAVERSAMEGCKVKQAWMPALGGVVNVVKPCVGVSLLPGWEREDGVRGRLQLAPGCSTKLLGLSVSPGGSAGGAAAGSRGQAAEDAQQKVPKGVASCWALKLQYGRAANVTDWLQLTKCPLLRYSYVPFVSKRLEPQTMLPLPHFRKQQLARPPPLPPLPPQMQMQQRFGMPQMLPPPYHMQQRPMMPLQPMPGQMQGMQPVPMPMQGVPPMQMPMQGMQHMDTMAMQMEQHGMPPSAAADGPNGAAVLNLAGSAQGAGEGPDGPAPNAAAAAAAAAHEPSDAAGGSSNGAQQQDEQQPVAAADQQVHGASAVATGPKQQLEPGSVPQEQELKQQQLAGANPTPASMRVGSKQWKEQVMQQFLAQQSTFGAKPVTATGPRQEHAGPVEPTVGDKAVKAGAGGSAGSEPMQE